MVLVRKFFCFELFTTGLLLGWLGLVESITSCITSILMLENVDSLITPEQFPDQDLKPIKSMIINIVGTNIALNLIDLLASGLLIAGTVKRNRLLLLPWLINGVISVVFQIAGTILAIVIVASSNSTNFTTFIPILVIGLIGFGVFLYAWIAIYSLYDVIRRTQPNNEYSSLIEDRNATGYPIYTRA